MLLIMLRVTQLELKFNKYSVYLGCLLIYKSETVQNCAIYYAKKLRKKLLLPGEMDKLLAKIKALAIIT